MQVFLICGQVAYLSSVDVTDGFLKSERHDEGTPLAAVSNVLSRIAHIDGTVICTTRKMVGIVGWGGRRGRGRPSKNLGEWCCGLCE